MTNTCLAYQQLGTGADVVLVHGFAESKAIWQGFIEPLSAHFRVTVLDLGGFGESAELLPSPTSIEALAEQVGELMEYLAINKFAWVGHSLGGYVGLAFAKKYPKKLWGLSLFHSTSLHDSEEKQKVRENVMAFIDKNGVEPFIENFVAPLFYEKRLPELQSEIDFVKEIAKKTPKKTLIEVTRAMKNRSNQTGVLVEADFPIQFIIGRHDGAVPFETYLTQIILPRNANIQVLDQTAHMGMFERPQQTLRMLTEFLQTWI